MSKSSNPNPQQDSQSWTVEEPLLGARLDKLVAELDGCSRKEARIAILAGRVLVNGRVCRILGRRWSKPMRLTLLPEPSAEQSEGKSKSAGAASDSEPVVLAQEAGWWVVAKPSGWLSEPNRSPSPSIESWMQSQTQIRSSFLVHRLDAGTSGLMIVATKKSAATRFYQMFREQKIRKRYLAWVKGAMTSQTVNAPIGRVQGMRQGVLKSGKPSETRFKGVSRSDACSLVEAFPKTGRTHQIRVHAEHLGHPLLGDKLYGGPRWVDDGKGTRHPVRRVMLHATSLKFRWEGQLFEYHLDPPADFESLRGLNNP